MTAHRSFLSAAAYSLGQSRRIEELQELENLLPAAFLDYKNRGHRVYCHDERPFSEMCRVSAIESLRIANVRPETLDAVLFANSNAGWSASDEIAILSAFREMGVPQTKIIGLQFQNCSGFGCALDIATNLLRYDEPSRVLIVLCGNAKKELSRFDPHTRTVFGDGAASCIVSNDAVGFEILSTMTLIDPSLATSDHTPSLARLRFKNLRKTIEDAYLRAGIGPKDITTVLGTNGNILYFELMGEAAGVPSEKVYRGDLDTLGHIYSCDNIIALRNHSLTTAVNAGNYFLVIGWSPYAVSATILRAMS